MRFLKATLLSVSITAVCGCSLLPVGEIDTAPRGKHTNSEEGGLQVRLSERGNMESYVVRGQRYHTLQSSEGYSARGVASWYGPNFHGRLTSNGEVYDMYRLSAAHRSLPLPSYVRVTHLENGKSVVLKVNDRGPFSGDRLIDLSFAAALKLDMVHEGTAKVDIQAISADELMAMTGPENMLDIDFYDPVKAKQIRENGELVTVDASFNVDAPAQTTEAATAALAQSAATAGAQVSEPIPATATEVAAGVAEVDLPPLDASAEPAQEPLVAGQKLDIDALVEVENELVKQVRETVFYVQAGVFPTADAAERAAVDVVLELPNESVSIKPLKGSDLHRVTVGPVVTSRHAQLISASLADAGIDNFAVKVKE